VLLNNRPTKCCVQLKLNVFWLTVTGSSACMIESSLTELGFQHWLSVQQVTDWLTEGHDVMGML